MAITTVQGQMLTAPLTLTGNLTFSDGSTQTAAASPYVLKNRIINGAMMIDQRNAGASVTAGSGTTYLVDRYRLYCTAASKLSFQQNAGSVTPPVGFSNYLGFTSLAATSLAATDEYTFVQPIEGLNTADLAWGTANAKTVTLSFWAYSSLTGTFGGTLHNSAQNRCYPFSFSLPVANTWTYITITVAGDTSGTWLTTNGIGIAVRFGLGVGTTYSGPAGAWSSNTYDTCTGATSVVGTNGATFYITGVQLEIGTSATPFERRLYGQELALCQRYYEKSFNDGTAPANGASGTTWASGSGLNAFCSSNNSAPGGTLKFLVTKRADPTITIYGNNAGAWAFVNPTASTSVSWSTAVVFGAGANGTTVGNAAFNNTLYCFYGHWTASAEL